MQYPILFGVGFKVSGFFSLDRSLIKPTLIGLAAQPIQDELVEEIMVQGGSVSPIVTVEPRRRKFHKPVTMTIPLPPVNTLTHRKYHQMSNGHNSHHLQNGCKDKVIRIGGHRKDPIMTTGSLKPPQKGH